MNRRIDELGRIVIPKEIRKTLNINSDDLLSITIKDKNIVLSKLTNSTLECLKQKVLELENSQNINDFEMGQLVAYRDVLDKMEIN